METGRSYSVTFCVGLDGEDNGVDFLRISEMFATQDIFFFETEAGLYLSRAFKGNTRKI